MKLHEEFKLYENMWEATKEPEQLVEALDYVAELKSKATAGAWYTEYFAVGLAYEDKTTEEILTLEDLDYNIPEDLSNYNTMPIVFGPNMYRTYSKESHETLEDALEYVINNLYSDSDLASEITNISDLFSVALMGDTSDNSATFIVAYGPDVQDDYGCYMRVSQKPLNSNKNLGKYYRLKPSTSAPHLLAEMMDNGVMSDDSSAPSFDRHRYAWQAK